MRQSSTPSSSASSASESVPSSASSSASSPSPSPDSHDVRAEMEKIHNYLASMSNLCNKIAAFIDGHPEIFDYILYRNVNFFPQPYGGGHIEIDARYEGKKIAHLFNKTFPGTEWVRTNDCALGPYYSADIEGLNIHIRNPEPRKPNTPEYQPLEL